MPQDPHLDFPTVCTYVGQLFLETRHRLEQLSRDKADLQSQLAAALRERDGLLKLVADKKAE